jgi:hypothetical protein
MNINIHNSKLSVNSSEKEIKNENEHEIKYENENKNEIKNLNFETSESILSTSILKGNIGRRNSSLSIISTFSKDINFEQNESNFIYN